MAKGPGRTGVNPGGRDAPGSKPLTELVQLVVFPHLVWVPGCFPCPLTGPVRSGLWALGRLRPVKRPRSWRTGVTLRQGSLQPTRPANTIGQNVESQAAGVTFQLPRGRDVGQLTRHNAKGPKTRRLEGKGLDLRGHHLCGARHSQDTNPRTVAGDSDKVSSPAEADDASLGCGRNHGVL